MHSENASCADADARLGLEEDPQAAIAAAQPKTATVAAKRRREPPTVSVMIVIRTSLAVRTFSFH